MVRLQIDDDGETLEEALKRANVEAKAKKESTPFPCRHCKSDRLPDSIMASLATLPHEKLIAVVAACNAYHGWIKIALMSEAQQKAFLRTELMAIAAYSEDDKIKLGAIEKMLDRLEGKAVQMIEAKIGIVDIVMEATRQRRERLSGQNGQKLLESHSNSSGD